MIYQKISTLIPRTAKILAAISFMLVFVSGLISVAQAMDHSSSNFIVKDPVISGGGGESTSTSYKLTGVIGQIGLGVGTITNFQLYPGFLYYPEVSTSVVSATAGDAQVSLSWTVSEAFLGWSVGGYNIGRSTSSGGPYAYTDAGSLTNTTVSSLTNGTIYYFIVRTEDAFGNVIATSTEVSATPQATAPACGDGSCNGDESCSTCSADCGTCPSGDSGSGAVGGGSGGGGGGGGVALAPQPATAVFKGRAYPESKVVLLKDGQTAVEVPASPDSEFEMRLAGLSAGRYNFGVWSEDYKGKKSLTQTFTIQLTSGATTVTSGIFLAPTIDVDKTEVKRGDTIVIFGQSVSDAEITIGVASEEEIFVRAKADKDGVYLYNFDTSMLERGDHLAKSKAALAGEISPFGRSVLFLVGEKSILKEEQRNFLMGDLNDDGRVNIIDFSIAAYWWKRFPLSPEFAGKEIERLNADGKLDLIDFSIMAYYWTG